MGGLISHLSNGLSPPQMKVKKVELGEEQVKRFQNMCDNLRLPAFEEEFRVPALTVAKVVHVIHDQTRAEYALRTHYLKKLRDASSVPRISAKSQQVDIQVCLESTEVCDATYNEFYTFHGSSAAAIEGITDSDFLINTADNGWTFGRGVYASEYLSHAQWFSQLKHNPGDNLLPVLMCRTFCGRAQDAGMWERRGSPHENVSKFEKNIEDNIVDSTMGVEWPEHPVLREFILPDDDQILPEFIIYFSVPEEGFLEIVGRDHYGEPVWGKKQRNAIPESDPVGPETQQVIKNQQVARCLCCPPL